VETLVNKGHHVIIEKGAAKKNAALAKGINLVEGKITHQAVAEAFNLPYTTIENTI
jgi:alanine dehydrogenase